MPDQITPPAGSTGFFLFGAVVALQTIVTPTANTKGIRVYGAFGSFPSGGSPVGRVMWKASAPTSTTDNGARTLMATSNPPGFGFHAMPFTIPAGQGLYAQKDDASTQAYIGVEYEVIP